jgi:hypothetical protein
MPTQASAATGIIVKFGGSPIPELTNATDIGMAFNMVDVSAHDGNGWSSSIPTLKRGKPITLEMNFVPGNAVHGSLFAAALTRASTAVEIVLPTSGNPTWNFQAFVGDIGISAAPVDGALPLRAILTPDGAMDFTIP